MSPAKCRYCDEPAVACLPVSEGEAPANPKHAGTKLDMRRIIPIRVCAYHNKVLQEAVGDRKDR